MQHSHTPTMYSEETLQSIATLMHAHGDVANPDPQTVEVMCGLIENYIDDVISEALRAGRLAQKFEPDMLLLHSVTKKADYDGGGEDVREAVGQVLAEKRAVERIVGNQAKKTRR